MNVGKIRKNDEERVIFLGKKLSHLLKLHLYQNGMARKIPVVAGHLVFILHNTKLLQRENRKSSLISALFIGIKEIILPDRKKHTPVALLSIAAFSFRMAASNIFLETKI